MWKQVLLVDNVTCVDVPIVVPRLIWFCFQLLNTYYDRHQRTAGARLVELSTIGCERPTTLCKTPVAVSLREGVGVDLMTQRWSDASC
eukprot:4148901-Prymnesium_polylepis.1